MFFVWSGSLNPIVIDVTNWGETEISHVSTRYALGCFSTACSNLTSKNKQQKGNYLKTIGFLKVIVLKPYKKILLV